MNQAFDPPHRQRYRAFLIAGIIFMLLLVPWLLLGNWYRAGLIRQERATVSTQSSVMANSLVFSVNQRLALLQGLYAFTRAEWPSADFDYPFEVFSSDIYFKSNGISSLMVAPEGIARYVYPLYTAKLLSGYDVINDPDPATRADVQRAIHTHEITLSQPGELPEGGLGLRAWRAVYLGSDLWGLVSISLNLTTILKDTGLSKPSTGLLVSLRDNSGNDFFGKEEIWQQDPVVQTINLPEGTWQLGTIPGSGWEKAVGSQVLFFRIISLALVIFLSGIVFLIVTRQEQQARMAVLEERQRLARDLHDSISQVLYSIGLGAKSAREALKHSPGQAEGALEYIEKLAKGGQAEMRALIFDLRPDAVSTDGLVAALERLGQVLHARYKIEVETQFCEEPHLSTARKEALYKIAQEAASNISKHARATRAAIKLEKSGDTIRLAVADNGVGFDPHGGFPGHLGLRSMRERAAKNGIHLTITSAPDQGTRVECVVPLKMSRRD